MSGDIRREVAVEQSGDMSREVAVEQSGYMYDDDGMGRQVEI